MFVACGAIVIGTATNTTGVKEIDAYLGNHGKGMQLNVADQYSIDLFF